MEVDRMYLNESLGTMTAGDADGMELTEVLKANQKANYNRRLLGIGLTGQTAIDGAIEITVGKTLIASLKTQQASNALLFDELIPLNGQYFLQEDLGTLGTVGDTTCFTLTPNLKLVEEFRQNRIISGMALSGGSAESDSALELLSGRTSIHHVYNSRTDEAIFGNDIVPCRALAPGNVPLIGKVTDAFPADCHLGLLYKTKNSNRPNIPRGMPINIACTETMGGATRIHMLMVP